MEKRNDVMCKLRFDEHYTLAEIGEMYGVSPEWVRRLTGDSGGRRNRSRKNLALDNKRIQFVLAHPELTGSELIMKFHVPANIVRQFRSNVKVTAGNSCIAKGNRAELAVSKLLTEAGIDHELMPNRAPYDIQLRNGLRVEVKSSTHALHPPSQYAPFYVFGLRRSKRGDYADVFALVVHETGDTYFVPASALTGDADWVRIPAMPEEFRLLKHPSRYDQYKNNLSCLWVQRQKGN